MTSTPVAYLLIGMVLGAGIALLVSALIRRLGRWLTLHSAHRGMDPIEAGETADLPVESDEGMNAQRAQLRDPVDVGETAEFPVTGLALAGTQGMDVVLAREPTASLGNVSPMGAVTVQQSRDGQRGERAELSPGFSWAVADTPGLEMDLHMRAVGDVVLVRVRTSAPQTFLRTGEASIPLSPVEIPWYDGTVVDGSCSFTRAPRPAPEFTLRAIARPEFVTRLAVSLLDNWLAVTADQPTLAVTAANLFVPEDLSPIESWRQRLDAYTTSIGADPHQSSSLIWLAPGQIRLAGAVVPRVGLGTRNDTVPSVVIEVNDFRAERPSDEREARHSADSATRVDSRLDRLWVPSGAGDDWGGSCYVFDLLAGE